jgi:hypothetical protein
MRTIEDVVSNPDDPWTKQPTVFFHQARVHQGQQGERLYGRAWGSQTACRDIHTVRSQNLPGFDVQSNSCALPLLYGIVKAPLEGSGFCYGRKKEPAKQQSV